MKRLYRIICLQRSDLGRSETDRHKKIIYWQPNRAGYTNKLGEAGIYSGEDLDDCAGDGFDWVARPLFRKEMKKNEMCSM